MARVGQYKALGTKLGGYKSTLSKIESKEYGKKHADWKAAEEISLYNQIGGTVANVIGIAQESRLAREQADMYAREFGIDPGDKFAKRVTKEGKEQNPWLKLSEEAQDEAFWADENMSDKVVGLPETPDSQSSLFEGEPGETSPISRQNISGGIADTETAYQESLKNFSPSPRKSVHQLESESLRRGATEKSADNKVFDAMTDPSSAGGIERIKGVGEELEFGHAAQKEVKPEAYPSQTFAGQKVPEGVDPEYAGMIEKERGEETPFGHVVKQRQKEINNPSSNPESKVFEAIKGDDEKPILGYDKNEVIDIASQSVPRGRESEIQMVYGMESSYGQDPGAQGNILQIKNEGLLKEAGNIDLSDPQAVSKFYIKKTDEFTKDFSKYDVQSGDLATSKTGKTFDIFGTLESQGIDKAGTRYLTWQQGRKGVADMATALKTGKIGEKTVENMLNNLSEDQKKSIIAAHGKPPYDDTKLLGFSKKSGTKNFIQAWLKIQNEKMGKY
jgi:hypothetical protein